MVKRIDDLYDNHSPLSRDEVRKLLTKWDNDQGRSMLTAEKFVSIPPKKYRWSPKLRNAAVRRRYWKLCLREVQYNEEYSQTFAHWQRKIQQYDSNFFFSFLGVEIPVETVRLYYNKVNRLFRRYQKESVPLRMKTYQELLEHYEDDNNSETKKESRKRQI
jgi:hypothetical protein